MHQCTTSPLAMPEGPMKSIPPNITALMPLVRQCIEAEELTKVELRRSNVDQPVHLQLPTQQPLVDPAPIQGPAIAPPTALPRATLVAVVHQAVPPTPAPAALHPTLELHTPPPVGLPLPPLNYTPGRSRNTPTTIVHCHDHTEMVVLRQSPIKSKSFSPLPYHPLKRNTGELNHFQALQRGTGMLTTLLMNVEVNIVSE